jgi:hypothetical protein
MVTTVKNSRSAWVVGTTGNDKPIPLLPLPRLIPILDALRSELTDHAFESSVYTVAMELREPRHVVSAVASAMRQKVNARKVRYRRDESLDVDDDERDEGDGMPAGPAAVDAFAELVALRDARARFLERLDAAAEASAQQPTRRDLLLFARQALQDQARYDETGTMSELYGYEWNVNELYHVLRNWLAEDVKNDALNKRVERFRNVLDQDDDLSQAFADYLAALTDVSLKHARQGEGYVRESA